LTEPSAKLFTGADLDDAQKITAALVLYVIKMGVDPRLVVLASEAGPNEIRWLQLNEARDLRVAYESFRYKPWHVEPYRGGAIAVSESNDGQSRMTASCSKQLGPNLTLIDATTSWDIAAWFTQCREMLPFDERGHPVFGTLVDPSRVQVVRFRPKCWVATNTIQWHKVSRAISHETIAPFAPLRGAGVERTGLNVFAVSGCVLAVFVGGDHWVITTFDEANLFHSTALAVIGSTMFRF
jgi:hypothetical protein